MSRRRTAQAAQVAVTPEAPDWPASLKLAPPEPEKEPAPSVAFLFGVLKDGRHAAVEVQVRGRAAVTGTVLAVGTHSEHVAHAFERCAFARLYHRREYTPAEVAANTREGRGATLKDVDRGGVVLLARVGKKTVASAAEWSEGSLAEPEVIASGDLMYAWMELHAWMQRNLLPRRRRWS